MSDDESLRQESADEKNELDEISQYADITDTQLLNELLEFLDVYTGVLDVLYEAISESKALVEVEPGTPSIPPIEAFDNSINSLTAKTMQIRAKRALVEGITDEDI